MEQGAWSREVLSIKYELRDVSHNDTVGASAASLLNTGDQG